MRLSFILFAVCTIIACREDQEAPQTDFLIPTDGGPATDGPPPADQTAADGAQSDQGSSADTGSKDQAQPADQGNPADSGPASSLVVITEFMADPDEVGDTSGEWLELHNPGGTPIDIQGWTLKDSGTSGHVISGSLVIPANGYVVLGRKTDTTTNGGVPVDYAYSSFSLTNSGDEIILLDASQQVVDEVAYELSSSSKWFIFAGYSTTLKSPSLDNSKKENWCFGASAWSTSDGDYGTPGKANVCPGNMVPTGCSHTTSTTLQFNSHLCAPMIAQWKMITIRNGHDTKPVANEWTRFYCIGSGFELQGQITVARHTTYGGITQQEWEDDGFQTWQEMFDRLKVYYPNITSSSPATVFRWATPDLCDWP